MDRIFTVYKVTVALDHLSRQRKFYSGLFPQEEDKELGSAAAHWRILSYGRSDGKLRMTLGGRLMD